MNRLYGLRKSWSFSRRRSRSFRDRDFTGLMSQKTASEGGPWRTRHWCSSGFANTDLDLHLKKHGIHKLIVMGLIAYTCVEATVRYAAELGYEVTVVKDATASYSDEHMHAALEVNLPNYASAIVTTDEIVGTLASIAGVEVPAGS